MGKNTDRVLEKIALPVIALAAGLLIVAYVGSVKSTSRENNGYIRVINCIISTPATQRTQTDIENCYKSVEIELGIKLQRYDNSFPPSSQWYNSNKGIIKQHG